MYSNEIKCKICEKILKEPIQLPCNKYICKAHENEFKEKQMKCRFCSQVHIIPDNGWQIDVLRRNIISFYQTFPNNFMHNANYRDLKEKLVEYERQQEAYKTKAENTANLIEQYFSNLISQIHLRSQILKQNIDELSVVYIKIINEEKEKYIKTPETTKINQKTQKLKRLI